MKLKTLPKLKLGDILLIGYRADPLSYLVRKFTNSIYNHAAFIYDQNRIIECKRNGVTFASINKYKRIAKTIKILRFKEFDPSLAMGIFLTRTGKQSYWKFLISFILIGIGYRGKLPRDTCSGLIAECLATTGFFFRKDKLPSRITPEDINQCKMLEVIYSE